MEQKLQDRLDSLTKGHFSPREVAEIRYLVDVEKEDGIDPQDEDSLPSSLAHDDDCSVYMDLGSAAEYEAECWESEDPERAEIFRNIAEKMSELDIMAFTRDFKKE